MAFPVTYFTQTGRPKAGAAGAEEAWHAAQRTLAELAREVGSLGTDDEVAAVVRSLHASGFSIARAEKPLSGQVARVQIDVYGVSAADVERTLLDYGGRCDAASEADEVAYGRCVIERNLEEGWGEAYSWRGRLTLHPTIGSRSSLSSERAVKAIGETLDRPDPR